MLNSVAKSSSEVLHVPFYTWNNVSLFFFLEYIIIVFSYPEKLAHPEYLMLLPTTLGKWGYTSTYDFYQQKKTFFLYILKQDMKKKLFLYILKQDI